MEGRLPPGRWHLDETGKGYIRCLRIDELLYAGKTTYQRIKIFRNESFGKVLVLDDDIQLSEVDEWVYHEALVHPALFTHPEPSRVAVIGGGDGGALREVLKHRCVKEAYLVDMDREVVELCRRHLPEVHEGSLEDSRVKIVYMEGAEFLKGPPEKFEALILDITEPTSNVAKALYSAPFYELVKRALDEDGIVALQVESIAFFQAEDFSLPAISSILSSVFPIVRPYVVGIPSFGSLWGFAIASKRHDPMGIPEATMAKRVAERRVTTRYYTPRLHKALFALPKFLADALEKEAE